MAVAQSAQEQVKGGVEGMGEGVPGLKGADGATLLELDESAAGQAAARCELVVGPSARGP